MDKKKKDKKIKHIKGDRVAVWKKKETIAYENELKRLQIELLKMQNYVKDTGKKVLMIFEGRDAAGKGGTIKRITEHLNPRGARVVALDKPSDIEKTQWYFQRYVQHLPASGEHEVPEFEKMLINSDIQIFKFYFSVSKDEQKNRFDKRRTDPLKQYKLSPVDEKSQGLWDKYTIAKYSMLLASHTEYAPWTVIRSDNKKKARINSIKHILNHFDYPDKIDKKELKADDKIRIPADQEIKIMETEMTLKKTKS